MKKLLIASLVMMFGFVLVACGTTDDPEEEVVEPGIEEVDETGEDEPEADEVE